VVLERCDVADVIACMRAAAVALLSWWLDVLVELVADVVVDEVAAAVEGMGERDRLRVLFPFLLVLVTAVFGFSDDSSFLR